MGITINAEAEARRHRQKPENTLEKHFLGDEVINNATATMQLPRGLRGNEVIFLANVCTDIFLGVALVIARPKNPAITPYDWNWDYPTFTNNWEIVDNKLVSYKGCKRIKQCGCVFSLLEKYFQQEYPTFGWELQYNDAGDLVGVIVRDYADQSKLKTA